MIASTSMRCVVSPGRRAASSMPSIANAHGTRTLRCRGRATQGSSSSARVGVGGSGPARAHTHRARHRGEPLVSPVSWRRAEAPSSLRPAGCAFRQRGVTVCRAAKVGGIARAAGGRHRSAMPAHADTPAVCACAGRHRGRREALRSWPGRGRRGRGADGHAPGGQRRVGWVPPLHRAGTVRAFAPGSRRRADRASAGIRPGRRYPAAACHRLQAARHRFPSRCTPCHLPISPPARTAAGGGGISKGLAFEDMSNKDLTKLRLTKVDMRAANFANSNLSGARATSQLNPALLLPCPARPRARLPAVQRAVGRWPAARA
jgi:hypothetical protein